MDDMVNKAGKRMFVLYHLKRAGVNKADLITIYIGPNCRETSCSICLPCVAH